jgi:hypothetical protein
MDRPADAKVSGLHVFPSRARSAAVKAPSARWACSKAPGGQVSPMSSARFSVFRAVIISPATGASVAVLSSASTSGRAGSSAQHSLLSHVAGCLVYFPPRPGAAGPRAFRGCRLGFEKLVSRRSEFVAQQDAGTSERIRHKFPQLAFPAAPFVHQCARVAHARSKPTRRPGSPGELVSLRIPKSLGYSEMMSPGVPR